MSTMTLVVRFVSLKAVIGIVGAIYGTQKKSNPPKRGRGIDMKHTCHWPNCKNNVPPAMWGCSKHWFTLPKFLRDQVWRSYRAGQEITKTPSPEYVVVAKLVQLWIKHFEETGEKLSEKEFCGPFMEKTRLAGGMI